MQQHTPYLLTLKELTMTQSYVGGNAGANDIRATNNPEGTILFGGDGNDILRGGAYDDILNGGGDDDQMFGGAGADQFRFFATDVNAVDVDKVYDLSFAAGDKLVFAGFGSAVDAAGLDAFAGGTSQIVTTMDGLVSLVNQFETAGGSAFSVTRLGATEVTIIKFDLGGGLSQEIHLSNSWTAYTTAGGVAL
jgi:Ca2+-binding RTX toxin-like protein